MSDFYTRSSSAQARPASTWDLRDPAPAADGYDTLRSYHSDARAASRYDSGRYGAEHDGDGDGDDDGDRHARDPYYEHDEERDAGFDVRADFDGTGPRWSEMQAPRLKPDDYRPVSQQMPSGSDVKEELVSVPVLGPEWKRSELHEMSKRGRSEARHDARRSAWLAWNRGQRGTCGVPWLTRRVLTFVAFFFVAALIVTLYFVIPRAVTFSFYTDSPFSVDNSTVVFNRSPTNFSFTGDLNLLADTSSSYLPVHFSNAVATVYDLSTMMAIATGDLGNYKMPHGSSVAVVFPVTFSYSAANDSDTTWLDMYDACGHEWTGTTRPDLKFRLEIRQSIIGMATHATTETQITDVTCPFELPSDSV
ncbi:hypothetical protein Q5752_000990 [Cryptotrichosporon argae]